MTPIVSLPIDHSISVSAYTPLDLSVSNLELAKVDLSSSKEIGAYVNRLMINKKARVAYGGYLEVRNIYQRSAYFKAAVNPKDERNIHLGVDFWAEVGTSVYAFYDGVVHSFQNNRNHGDYGPTIILAHEIDGERIYSLYGHLSLASISGLEVGQQFRKGDQIGELGNSDVNGDYAPHLHFQLIKDLQGKQGDYPGVCSEHDLEFYKGNCLDPLRFLGI